MKYVLAVFCVLVGLTAMATSATAKTSIHEIYGAILWLVASVLLIGAAIVNAVDSAKELIAAKMDHDFLVGQKNIAK